MGKNTFILSQTLFLKKIAQNFYTKRITLNEKKKKQKKTRIDCKNSIWTKTDRLLRLD